MVDWVENGNAPTEFVAAKYTNNNVTQGVQFTRKLCPVSSGLHTYIAPMTDTFRPYSTRRRRYTREATRTRRNLSSAHKRERGKEMFIIAEGIISAIKTVLWQTQKAIKI